MRSSGQGEFFFGGRGVGGGGGGNALSRQACVVACWSVAIKMR